MLYGEVRTGGWTLQGWGSGLDAVRRCDRLPAVQLAVIGGGRMGEALVAGLLRAGWDPEGIGVVEALPERREALAAALPGVVVTAMPLGAEGVVIAVKPADVAAACDGLGHAGVRRVLSIAAGVSTASIERVVGDSIAVVRAMPNTPALVGLGASAIAPGAHALEDDLAWAETILSAVGIVVRVGESQLDAVTGLTGSGPAYLFLVAEALIEAGVLVGLARDVSARLTRQLFVGAAALLDHDGGLTGPEALRAQVTSPGGTTAAGLRALEDRGLRAAMLAAVDAATERSRQLGRP
jgi:pyrroline-5-carboxylate reductase